jgi:ketosteroid isomerase-like protein
VAAQPTSRLCGPRMMSRFLVVWAEPSSWDGRRYRRGWIGQARTMQMAFAAGRSSAVWSMRISLLVQKEIIEAHIGGGHERVKQELRVTMVFRRNRDGWRIVHGHADSQTETWPPR